MFRDNVQLPYYMKYLLKTSEKKKNVSWLIVLWA